MATLAHSISEKSLYQPYKHKSDKRWEDTLTKNFRTMLHFLLDFLCLGHIVIRKPWKSIRDHEFEVWSPWIDDLPGNINELLVCGLKNNSNFHLSIKDRQSLNEEKVPGNKGSESSNLPRFVQSSRLTGTGTKSCRHHKKSIITRRIVSKTEYLRSPSSFR